MARIDLDQSRPRKRTSKSPVPRSRSAPGRSSARSARYVQIAEGIKAQILRGDFGPSGRLPTTRDLARKLRVNRQTVVAAYQKLQDWGLVRPHVGRGTFSLSDGAAAGAGTRGPEPTGGRRPAALGAPENRPRELPGPGSPAPWSGFFSRAFEGRKVANLSAIYSIGASPGTISFAGSFPAQDLLPARGFRLALERVLRGRSRRALAYGPAQGFPPLRQWIAAEMSRRGTPTSPEEVLITNGSQQGIDLIARAFTDPGDLVLLENPTYSGAISTFESFGARLAGLTLDADGVVPGTIGEPAARGRAKLLYLTPSFQNPTTSVLPLSRRRRVLAEAAAAGLLVVEDDWASGLRFEGEDPPTLRALDRDGRVIYVSTFAKKLIPGLRIGWIAAARPILDRLTALKQINDCCTSPLVQAALEEFCRGGGLDRHLPRVRAAYREKRDRMLAAMAREFPPRVGWTRPEGGLFLWVRLPEGIDARAVHAEAESRGVLVSTGDLFSVEEGGAGCLRLTFASARPSEIDEGVHILGSILRKQIAAARRRGHSDQEAVPFV